MGCSERVANVRQQLKARQLNYKELVAFYGTEKDFVSTAQKYVDGETSTEDWLQALHKCFGAHCDVQDEDNVTRLRTIARFLATMQSNTITAYWKKWLVFFTYWK